MIMRQAALNPSPSPDTPWGTVNQAMGILWFDEMSDQWPEANRSLAALAEKAPIHPHDLTEPAVYWGLGALVRTYLLFNAESEFFPGRLTPEAETVVKELLWNFVYGRSRIDETSPEQVWTIFDSENHDMMHKTVYYLAAVVFARDSEFSAKRYNDGGTPAQHEAAWAEWFKAYLKARATHGLWVEQNSSTYVKYTLAAFVNLYDFSPDPSLRQRVQMTLDITLIDWAQEQIKGVRGGGAARMLNAQGRTEAEVHSMWGIAWLLFRDIGGFAYQPPQQLFATSRYRPSEFAVALALLERSQSYEVRNRVLGEGTYHSISLLDLARERFGEVPPPAHHRQTPPIYTLSKDSRILHYSYWTPHYVLGMNILDPNAAYTLIATQSLWAGAVMPSRDDVSARIIAAPIDANGDGSHFDAFWGVQDKSAMILQKTRHAQHVSGMRIYFSPGLERLERDGWIFATNGMAYAGVYVAWGGYRLIGEHAVLEDAESPFILQMGTIEEFGSFHGFIDAVLRAPLDVDQGRIVYHGPGSGELTFFYQLRSGSDARRLGRYILPEVDGVPIEFEGAAAYSSPFLRGEWGEPQIEVRLGKHRAVFDFEVDRVLRSELPQEEARSWMTLGLRSPKEGATLSGPTTVELVVHSAHPVREIRVEVDGQAIYHGSQVPEALTINHGELDDGEHVLTLTAIDDRGETFRRSYGFRVSNVRIVSPRIGDRVAGAIRAEFESRFSGEQVLSASVRVDDQEVYRGSLLPASIDIDTLRFEDGSHELSVEVRTAKGALARDSVQFRVQNYWSLEDRFDPPTANWFGTLIDRSKTVEASSGWEYASGSHGELFGFASRRLRRANTSEYLIWNAPNLTHFSVDLLTTDPSSVREAVRLAVSPGGDVWIDVPFEIDADISTKGGWHHVEIIGDLLPDTETRLLRLTLLESEIAATGIEVGRVRLTGVQSKQVDE